MSSGLTGLRVKVNLPHRPVYGVARVRYNEGHRHAGNYEIEAADGTSFLAPYDSCKPGDRWDATPDEGRFTGSEIFRPSFLDDTGRALLTRSPGVIVAGSVALMRKLLDPVRKGWTVDWCSHGANEFRGTLTVDERGEGAFLLSGKQSFHYTWPQEGEEFEVVGNTLHEVRVPPKRTGKHPYRTLSLTFHRP